MKQERLAEFQTQVFVLYVPDGSATSYSMHRFPGGVFMVDLVFAQSRKELSTFRQKVSDRMRDSLRVF